jgi:hypothetical protein
MAHGGDVLKFKPGDVVDFGVEETAFRILS